MRSWGRQTDCSRGAKVVEPLPHRVVRDISVCEPVYCTLSSFCEDALQSQASVSSMSAFNSDAVIHVSMMRGEQLRHTSGGADRSRVCPIYLLQRRC